MVGDSIVLMLMHGIPVIAHKSGCGCEMVGECSNFGFVASNIEEYVNGINSFMKMEDYYIGA